MVTSLPCLPQGQVLILFPSPSVGLSFKLELISICPAQPHQREGRQTREQAAGQGGLCPRQGEGLWLDHDSHPNHRSRHLLWLGGLSVQCCPSPFSPTGGWATMGRGRGAEGDPAVASNPTQPAGPQGLEIQEVTCCIG